MVYNRRKKIIIISILIFNLCLSFVLFNSPEIGGEETFPTDPERAPKPSGSVSELWNYSTGGSIYSSPALGDVNGDGTLDVVIGSNDGKLYAINSDTGTLLWESSDLGTTSYSSPALGDVDGDNILEVIIGSSQDYIIYAIDGQTGEIDWQYTTGFIVYSTPALGDVDGDGMLDVVVGSNDFNVYAIDGVVGNPLWSYKTEDAVDSSPALGDIDGDGDLDVVVGSCDDKVYALDGMYGDLIWNFSTGSNVGSPALGDVNGDGILNVVVGSHDGKVYAINGDLGTLLWENSAPGYISYSSPALGDIDEDGTLEVVIGYRGGSNENKLYALNGENGEARWMFQRSRFETSPALGDVNGDDKLDVIVGNADGKIYALDGMWGNLIWDFSTGADVRSSPALGDIDEDGKLEVIVGSDDHNVYALNPTPSGEIICWQGLSGDSLFYRQKNSHFVNNLEENNPSYSVLKLQKDGIEINNIDVGEFFNIYVGDSIDEDGIAKVRFSSDDVQDGLASGEWTDFYNWTKSSGDWNAETKIKRWLFATPGKKEVWTELIDTNGHWDREYRNIYAVEVSLILTEALEIYPKKDYYQVGEVLTANFTIKNVRDYSITLDILTVGGRLNGWCPDDICPDFSHKSVDIMPHKEYEYEGTITLSQPGNYHFFIAYNIENPSPNEKPLLDENNWNTCVNLGNGLSHRDRIKNIIVLEEETVPDEVSPLRNKILEEIEKKVKYPPYLLDPDAFDGAATSTVWYSFTSWLTQSNLIEKYDHLYQTGVDYDCESFISLKNAKAALDNGNINNAKEYLSNYYSLQKLSAMSFSAAAALFDDGLKAAEEWVENIRHNYLGLLRLGTLVLAATSHPAAKIFDYIYIFADHGIDYYFSGEEEDAKKLKIAILINIVFDGPRFKALGDKTLSEYLISKSTTLPRCMDIFGSELDPISLSQTIQQRFADELAVEITEEVAEKIALKFYNELINGISWVKARIKSPIEISVNDSIDFTGISNDKISHGVSRSYFFNNTVNILFPKDSYSYYIKGMREGSYGFEVKNYQNGTISSFLANEIPTSLNETHHFEINWDELAQGRNGVLIELDIDGDGKYDYSFYSDNELTQEEFYEALTADDPMDGLIFFIMILSLIGNIILLGTAIYIWKIRKR